MFAVVDLQKNAAITGSEERAKGYSCLLAMHDRLVVMAITGESRRSWRDIY